MKSWHTAADGNPSALLLLVVGIWSVAGIVGMLQFHNWIVPTLIVWGIVAIVWIAGSWVQRHSLHN
jgi:hypothetical protein